MPEKKQIKPAKRRMVTVRGQKHPTVYSKTVHKKIVSEVAKGKSVSDAGLLAGLGKDVVWTWLENGRKRPEQYPHFAELVADIEKARAEKRGEIVERIVATGLSGQPGTWQAGAWYLERTDPENWGRKDKVEHVGGSEGPKTQINTVILVDSDAREAARDLLRRVAGHASPDVPVGPGGRLQLEAGEGAQTG